MTKRKQKKTQRRKKWTVDGAPMKPELKEMLQAAESGSGVATYNGPVRSVLDNTIPGGVRWEPAV